MLSNVGFALAKASLASLYSNEHFTVIHLKEKAIQFI